MENELKKISGFISEDELDDLVVKKNDIAGATGTPCDTVSISVGVITMTIGMDFCPTSACTKACK